jgi:hypothetical protein
LDSYHSDSLYVGEKECEDPWLFFEGTRGLRLQTFKKNCPIILAKKKKKKDNEKAVQNTVHLLFLLKYTQSQYLPKEFPSEATTHACRLYLPETKEKQIR